MSAFSDVELLQDFLTEAGDLLEDVDSKLVELEQSPEDADLLATVFRGFHTIKGGAGFLEATHLVELCHKTENLFDLLRSKKLVLDAEMMDSIMAATGEVHRMFGEMRNGHQPGAAPQELLEALDAAIEGRTVAPAAAPVVPVVSEAPAQSQAKTLNELAQISEDDLDWAGLYEAVVGVPPRELEQAALSTGMATEAIARQAAAAVRPKAPPPKAKAAQPAAAVQKENTIRVDTARFDQILNLSGEIGLTKNRLNCLFQAFASGASSDELIKSLDTVVGQLDMLVSDLQSAVIELRAGKGMVLDSADHDTWSVGSFFMNPRVVTAPENAPNWPEADGSLKVSAAWLIEQAGFNKGFTLNGRAALSSKHTLAITNRGGATSADISELAEHIVKGVKAKFDIELKPEATFIA